MDRTDPNKSFIDANAALVGDYTRKQVRLMKLKFIRSASISGGILIWLVIATVLICIFLVFLGIVTALWLSRLTGDQVTGFAITAGLVLLLVFILSVFRKALFIKPVARIIIKQALDEKK